MNVADFCEVAPLSVNGNRRKIATAKAGLAVVNMSVFIVEVNWNLTILKSMTARKYSFSQSNHLQVYYNLTTCIQITCRLRLTTNRYVCNIRIIMFGALKHDISTLFATFFV